MFARSLLSLLTGLLASVVCSAGILPSPNPNRAYPPSCIPGDLPQTPSAETPVWSMPVPLAVSPATPPYSPEYATLKVWRVACSETRSAVLVRFERQSWLNGGPTAVSVPYLRIEQASTGLAFMDDVLRLSRESNTRSGKAYGWRTANSATFVLEVQSTASTRPNFDAAFRLRFDNSDGAAGIMFPGQSIAIPAYVPTPATYPNAFLPQVISGYHAALYIQPSNPGRSLSVSIYELPDPNIKEVFVNWNFQDATGKWWFLGQGGGITAGDRRANIIQLMYNDGAGYFRWGNATLEWDDCNTIHFTATPYPNLAAGVPNQPVSETWTRIAPFNALACE